MTNRRTMNMKAKKRILCACDEIGFKKYNVYVSVPKEHPFGRKGLDCEDFDISCAVLTDGWTISFSRSSLGDAINDSVLLVKYLDDMLEQSKIVDQHDLIGALVTNVDRIGDDSWKLTFRLKGGKKVEMFGDDEDHFIIYEA